MNGNLEKFLIRSLQRKWLRKIGVERIKLEIEKEEDQYAVYDVGSGPKNFVFSYSGNIKPLRKVVDSFNKTKDLKVFLSLGTSQYFYEVSYYSRTKVLTEVGRKEVMKMKRKLKKIYDTLCKFRGRRLKELKGLEIYMKVLDPYFKGFKRVEKNFNLMVEEVSYYLDYLDLWLENRLEVVR